MGCTGDSGMSKDNYITAIVEVQDFEEKDDIQIINSYDLIVRNTPDEAREGEDLDDEAEIKDVSISIDGAPDIPFTYRYNFKQRGKYRVKYTFHHPLKKTDYMFCYCINLIQIDLTHFNSEQVTNMSNMFFNLKKLEIIDVSKLNIKNVIDMSNMFFK